MRISDGFDSMTNWDRSENAFGWALTALDSSKKRSGSYSGRIDPNYPAQWGTYVFNDVWTPVNNTEETYYTVSGWAFLEEVTGNEARMFLMTRKAGETGYPSGAHSTSITTEKGKWVYLERAVKVPADVKELNIRIDNNKGGKVWFEDVKIVKGNSAKTIIIEEKNYYSFGLAHRGYNNIVSSNGNSTAQKFGFGGKELSEELGINTMDFGARNYDASLGRWFNVDPLAEVMESHSVYNYGFNNPIFNRDYDGRSPKGMQDPYLVFDGNENKIYIYDDNDTPENPSDDILLGTFDAHNIVATRSQGKWEDGIYPMYDKNRPRTRTSMEQLRFGSAITGANWVVRQDSPWGRYGEGGIYRAGNFTQSDGKNRSGMGVHAGRGYKPFLRRITYGCIRTTPEAIVAIGGAIQQYGSLTTITVKNNKAVTPREKVSAASTLTPAPIVPVTPSPIDPGSIIPVDPIVPSPSPNPAPKPKPLPKKCYGPDRQLINC